MMSRLALRGHLTQTDRQLHATPPRPRTLKQPVGTALLPNVFSSPSASARSDSSGGGVSLAELPKLAVFTARLPADSAFPTPAASAAAPLAKLGPCMVRGALFMCVPTPATAKPPELLAVSPAAFRDLGLALSGPTRPNFWRWLPATRPTM